MTERDRPDPTGGDLHGVPLREAADHLNTSAEAVRMRIRRKSLRAYKSDGRWYVVLPDPTGTPDQDATEHPTTEPTTSRDPEHDQVRDLDAVQLREIVRRQDDEIAFLRAELASRREAERELRIMLGRSQPTLRPIEAPQSVQTAGYEESVMEAHSAAQTGVWARLRRWWGR